MINEHAKGELRFLLILFACMVGMLVLLGIVGMIEVDTGERMTSPACAAPGGENECETSADCLDCQKCDDTKEPHKCVADCPPDKPICTEDGCVEDCDPDEKPSECAECEDGEWVENPPTENHICENGVWVCPWEDDCQSWTQKHYDFDGGFELDLEDFINLGWTSVTVGLQGELIFDYEINIYCSRSWTEWQGGDNCDVEEYIGEELGPVIDDDFHIESFDLTHSISYAEIGSFLIPELGSGLWGSVQIILDTLDTLWAYASAAYQAVTETFDTFAYISTVVEGMAWSCSDPCDE